jgi:hypothetical protein
MESLSEIKLAVLSEDRLKRLLLALTSFNEELAETASYVESISGRYKEMKSMRALLADAEQKQREASERVARELDTILATSLRITDELNFILAERDKIRFKAMNDYQSLPLPDVLEAGCEFRNPSWLNLYRRIPLESINN